ncbi:MAG TPA: hypothetical protein VLB29_14465 [Nocardioidaceae bacterium]|nr:hypothetical protein [Nocardioidaceae bacterium]
MRSRPSRVLTSLIVSLALGATALAGASASAATTDEPGPTLDVEGDYYYTADTDFGISWRVVYPDGMDASGWSTYCSIDGDAEAECTPDSLNAMTLPEGSHTVRITPRNTAESTSGETHVWELIVDVTPPAMLEHDDTLLARMGKDIVLPRMFEDAFTPYDWHCNSRQRDDVNLDGSGTDHVVLPSPSSQDSFSESYHCMAVDARWQWSESAQPEAIWDAKRPYSSLTRRLPGLITHPVWFRMGAGDFETSWAGESMRIFGRYRIITPRMTWRRLRTPDRWVTTRRATHPDYGWRRGFRLTQVPRGHHVCVGVGARDAVGFRHLSGRSCSTRAWDDRDLRRSAGWRERSPRGAYRRTALVTKRYGATLKLTRPSKGRGANILVRKCPGCGSVQFIGPDKSYWGADNLRYSLRAKRTHWAKIPVNWWQHVYRGNYTIKVISRGKPVMIDGLAVTPWRLRNKLAWTRQAENY